MLRGKRWCGIGGGTAMVMALIGCASPAPTASTSAPAPVATPTPAFTSDADAEAAAIYFFKRYLALSNSIGESETANPAPLRAYLAPDVYASEVNYLDSNRSMRERFAGPAALKKSQKQSIDLSDGTVVLYACIDLTKARVIDESGQDRTPPDRPDMTTLVVGFTGLPGRPLIESSERWSGPSIC